LRKIYKLLDKDGNLYSSLSKSLLGGTKRGKRYGTLDCRAALRAIKEREVLAVRRLQIARLHRRVVSLVVKSTLLSHAAFHGDDRGLPGWRAARCIFGEKVDKPPL